MISTPVRFFLISAISLGISGCLTTAKALTGVEDSPDAGRQSGTIQQALAAGQAGNFQQMLALCRIAASTPNADPAASRCVADAQAQLGNKAEAEAGYLAHLNRMPNDVDARLALAKMLMNNGRYQDAQSQLEKAVALNPSNPDGQFLLGESYRMQNQCKPAMERYNQALFIQSNHGPAMEGRSRAQMDNCKGTDSSGPSSFYPMVQPNIPRPTINSRTDGGPPYISWPGGPSYNTMPGGSGYNNNMPGGPSYNTMPGAGPPMMQPPSAPKR